jgi:hypothetical protein
VARGRSCFAGAKNLSPRDASFRVPLFFRRKGKKFSTPAIEKYYFDSYI